MWQIEPVSAELCAQAARRQTPRLTEHAVVLLDGLDDVLAQVGRDLERGLDVLIDVGARAELREGRCGRRERGGRRRRRESAEDGARLVVRGCG